MPVSGTHAIVGALVGFALLSDARDTVNYQTLIRIGISWILSPIFSGLIDKDLTKEYLDPILLLFNFSKVCLFLYKK